MGVKIAYEIGQNIGSCIFVGDEHSVCDKSGRKRLYANFLCSRCGTTFFSMIENIRLNKVRSCGCLLIEKRGESIRTHGLSKTPEYNVWNLMKNRCKDINDDKYGGRGISYCESWEAFDNFFKDMGSRPTPKHTLERINNNGDYEPGNCRWATRAEQALNRRSNIVIEYNGKSQTLKEWSDELSISYVALLNRYTKGWGIWDLFNVPVGNFNALLYRNPGKTVRLILDMSTGIYYDSVKEAAEAKNIEYKHLPRRLRSKRSNNTSLSLV